MRKSAKILVTSMLVVSAIVGVVYLKASSPAIGGGSAGAQETAVLMPQLALDTPDAAQAQLDQIFSSAVTSGALASAPQVQIVDADESDASASTVGEIVAQEPGPGWALTPNTQIRLVVNIGPSSSGGN